jgi:hypothetical protein
MQTGYRALPVKIDSPKFNRIYTIEEFSSFNKTKMQEADSLTPNHIRTIFWYVEKVGYVIEVDLINGEQVFIHSICTFTPTFGMDRIDGMFAQDAEEYVLQMKLGFASHRMASFLNQDSVDINTYLGLNDIDLREVIINKKWWQFWK